MIKKLSMPFLVVLLFSLSLVSFYGCGTASAEAEAEAFLERYFKSLKRQDFNGIHIMYDRSAFGVVSSTKALRGMKKTMKSFGPLQTYKFDKWSAYVKENTAAMLSLKFSYDVVYKEMHTREGFIVTKKNKGRWQITSHTIERL